MRDPKRGITASFLILVLYCGPLSPLSDAAGGSEEDAPYWGTEEGIEEWEPYRPAMTEGELARAELKDGWMVMPLENVEFT